MGQEEAEYEGGPAQTTISLIARAAKVPVFNLYEIGLGLGIVGGRLASVKEHGKGAACPGDPGHGGSKKPDLFIFVSDPIQKAGYFMLFYFNLH